MAAGAATAATLLGPPAAHAEATADRLSLDGPVAFTGSVKSDPDLSDNRFTVLIEPNQKTMDTMKVGDTVQMLRLPSERVVRRGGSRYAIVINPSMLPERYVGDDGLVTVTVRTVDPATKTMTRTTGTARLVRGKASPRIWDDPDRPNRTATLGAGGETAPNLAAAEDVPEADEDAADTWDGTFPDSTSGCGESPPSSSGLGASCITDDPTVQATIVAYSDRWAIIGTTYPVGTSSAEMKFVRDTSKSVTGGIAAYGGGSWSASGSKTVSTSWGTDWPLSQDHRGYKIVVKYAKYRWTECYSPGNCWYDYEWRPHHIPGGTGGYSATYPAWNYECQPLYPGSKWHRSSSSGYAYTLGTGVKIKDLIGIDLSVKRNYQVAVSYAYHVDTNTGSPKEICSNRGGVSPSYASKVNMRYKPR